MIRLPALIQITDEKYCSTNCQLMHYIDGVASGHCSARGQSSSELEPLKLIGDLYLRTEYCIKKAIDNPTRVEQCRKCKGKCDGETYSARTKCTNCGARFVRITDQDETYLTDADEFDKREREEFEKEFEQRRTR